MWYKNWNIIRWSEAVSTGYPVSSNRWRKDLSNMASVIDLAEGIKNFFYEYLLWQRTTAITRDKMKYIDFKGREWSLEKGDWISYQLIEKHNRSLFNKNIIKKFFYVIFLALLTAYFWLA